MDGYLSFASLTLIAVKPKVRRALVLFRPELHMASKLTCTVQETWTGMDQEMKTLQSITCMFMFLGAAPDGFLRKTGTRALVN